VSKLQQYDNQDTNIGNKNLSMPKNKYKNENILQPSTLNKQHKYQIFTVRREITRYEKLHNKEKKKKTCLEMQW